MRPYNTQQNKHIKKKSQHTQHTNIAHHAYRCSRPLYSSHTPHQPQPQANDQSIHPRLMMVNEQHTVLPETPNNAPTHKQTFDTNPTKCKEGCTPKKTKNNQLQPTHHIRCMNTITATPTTHNCGSSQCDNKNSLERR